MRKLNQLSLALAGSLVSYQLMAAPTTTTVSKDNPALVIKTESAAMQQAAPRPQDDFYQAINHEWLMTTQIPADKASWGTFYMLRESSLAQQHQIITQLMAKPVASLTPNQARILTLYNSFMDESAISGHGLVPLQPLFAQIDQLKDKRQLLALIAQFNQLGINTPLAVAIHPDAYQASIMRADLYQSGLNLPDRDYYLSPQDPKLSKILSNYQNNMEQLLALAGFADAAPMAKQTVALETKLAAIQWTNVMNRDPLKTNNVYSFKQLVKLAPAVKWADFLQASGIQSRVGQVIISQPSYVTSLARLIKTVPLATWQDYLRAQVVISFAADLGGKFEQTSFDFYGRQLRGLEQNTPRWQRALSLVNDGLGEALGQEYVANYFPATTKAEVLKLVMAIKAAYAQSIQSLTWMSAATKQKALQKLDKIELKIGYPDKWRDYSSLQLQPQSLIGNILALNQFEYAYNLAKLGKPVDRSVWEMTPQTVNAYYDPSLNEMVFPAAILQPPFFDPKADAAYNYGGIGAVIAHEISHGFDDQGSKYDANGNLHDWFTAEDHRRFKAQTQALVSQYSAYEPVPGYHVNGELTLGENIADNSGLAVAYRAYLASLNGQPAPIINQSSGPQRFYQSWAIIWRTKVREAQQIMALKTDPHSPGSVRANATLRNQDGFYSAFAIESADKMYLPPAKRVKIW